MRKEPHWADIYVGRQLRTLRKERRMSQTVLARSVGITFQQIQKYEKGLNRVSCSMLVELCLALECQPRAILPRVHIPVVSALVHLPKVRASYKARQLDQRQAG